MDKLYTKKGKRGSGIIGIIYGVYRYKKFQNKHKRHNLQKDRESRFIYIRVHHEVVRAEILLGNREKGKCSSEEVSVK